VNNATLALYALVFAAVLALYLVRHRRRERESAQRLEASIQAGLNDASTRRPASLRARRTRSASSTERRSW
jgi:hypothetical protein